MRRLFLNTCLLLTTVFMVAASDTNAAECEEPTSTNASARKNRNCFKKGSQIISVGYGIPGIGKSAFGDLDEIYPKANFGGIGPLLLRYEYSISDKWGLGLVTRFATSKAEYPVNGPLYDDEQNPIAGDSAYTYTETFRSIGVMARGNLHFGTSYSWDHYVGLGLGYGNSTYNVDLGGNFGGAAFKVSSPLPIAWEATIGTRYYFSKTVGAYVELGFSQSILNAGLSFTF
ncbi:MAG: hypothetical protein QMC70_10500 [Bacteroidia bacterium]